MPNQNTKNPFKRQLKIRICSLMQSIHGKHDRPKQINANTYPCGQASHIIMCITTTNRYQTNQTKTECNFHRCFFSLSWLLFILFCVSRKLSLLLQCCSNATVVVLWEKEKAFHLKHGATSPASTFKFAEILFAWLARCFIVMYAIYDNITELLKSTIFDEKIDIVRIKPHCHAIQRFLTISSRLNDLRLQVSQKARSSYAPCGLASSYQP